MCVNPIYIKNTGQVPCGRCYQCQMIRRNTWTARMLVEMQYAKKSYFLTLTYDDENLGIKDTETGLYLAEKKDYQNFLKRLRKDIDIRYFGVHEYGSQTLRKHYHIIIFTNYEKKLSQNYIYNKWKKGMVTVDRLNNARVHYTTKYLNKSFKSYNIKKEYLDYLYNNEPLDTYLDMRKNYILQKNTFNFMSLKPAIGHQLLNDNEYKKYFLDYVNREKKYPPLFIDGISYPMPRYYIERLVNENLRNEIFLNSKLNSKQKKIKESKRYNMSTYDINNNRYIKDELKLENMLNKVKPLSDIL